MKPKLFYAYAGGLFIALGFLLLATAFTPHYIKQSSTASKRFIDFNKLLSEAGLTYIQPAGFKDAGGYSALNNSFDYGLALPAQDFEIWFQVTSLKQSWLSYQRAGAAGRQQAINPDSAYLKSGEFKAEAVSIDGTYFERELRPQTLANYNADAGKTYLVELKDQAVTKHYSYALIITLQKNHVGNLMMMCLTNSKDADFFKNINRLKNAIRFK